MTVSPDDSGDGDVASAIAALPPLREVIAEHGLSARKGLGQHFLFDLNLTRRIARAAGPLENCVAVEIGPGPGGLTRALLLEGAARVLAVERDPRCRPVLEAIARVAPGRLEAVEADALTIHEPDHVPPHWIGTDGTPLSLKIVSNLPYNVGTPLLVRWLTTAPWPPWYQSLTLMLQKEVVDRMTAAAGSKVYGRLSVLSQWRARVRCCFDVPASAFVPPPKVASAIVSVHPIAPEVPCPVGALEKVTAAAFGQRRKMLRSSLKALNPAPEPWIESAGLIPTQRAEDVSVEAFCRLAAGLDMNGDDKVAPNT